MLTTDDSLTEIGTVRLCGKRFNNITNFRPSCLNPFVWHKTISIYNKKVVSSNLILLDSQEVNCYRISVSFGDFGLVMNIVENAEIETPNGFVKLNKLVPNNHINLYDYIKINRETEVFDGKIVKIQKVGKYQCTKFVVPIFHNILVSGILMRDSLS